MIKNYNQYIKETVSIYTDLEKELDKIDKIVTTKSSIKKAWEILLVRYDLINQSSLEDFDQSTLDKLEKDVKIFIKKYNIDMKIKKFENFVNEGLTKWVTPEEYKKLYVYNWHEERGELSVSVMNAETGKYVYEFNSNSLEGDDRENYLNNGFDLTEDGFMKNIEDIAGLWRYLVEMKLIEEDSELITEEEFENVEVDEEENDNPIIHDDETGEHVGITKESNEWVKVNANIGEETKDHIIWYPLGTKRVIKIKKGEGYSSNKKYKQVKKELFKRNDVKENKILNFSEFVNEKVQNDEQEFPNSENSMIRTITVWQNNSHDEIVDNPTYKEKVEYEPKTWTIDNLADGILHNIIKEKEFGEVDTFEMEFILDGLDGMDIGIIANGSGVVNMYRYEYKDDKMILKNK